jgi:hypothetical protein
VDNFSRRPVLWITVASKRLTRGRRDIGGGDYLPADTPRASDAIPPPEDSLAKAERHIRDGEARVARQIALVEKLDRGGHEHAADMARKLLAASQRALEIWRADYLRIERRMRGQGR